MNGDKKDVNPKKTDMGAVKSAANGDCNVIPAEWMNKLEALAKQEYYRSREEFRRHFPLDDWKQEAFRIYLENYKQYPDPKNLTRILKNRLIDVTRRFYKEIKNPYIDRDLFNIYRRLCLDLKSPPTAEKFVESTNFDHEACVHFLTCQDNIDVMLADIQCDDDPDIWLRGHTPPIETYRDLCRKKRRPPSKDEFKNAITREGEDVIWKDINRFLAGLKGKHSSEADIGYWLPQNRLTPEIDRCIEIWRTFSDANDRMPDATELMADVNITLEQAADFLKDLWLRKHDPNKNDQEDEDTPADETIEDKRSSNPEQHHYLLSVLTCMDKHLSDREKKIWVRITIDGFTHDEVVKEIDEVIKKNAME